MAVASIRPPAVAGQFYPADPRVLATMVSEFLASAQALECVPPPKALVVPHAGYIYSGPIAACAYAALRPLRETITRVVLLGPNHRVPLRGMALPASLSFAGPLGTVDVDFEAWQALRARPEIIVDDRPHAFEHCLEVQLPFLQSVLERFTLVPLVVGECPDDTVASVLEELWGGPETLIVISSDLSHYHTYAQAQLADQATVEQILHLDGRLDGHQACGAYPLNGLLKTVHRHRLEPHLLDLRNSGDTAGDRDRVVGYASIAFCEPEDRAHH